MAVETFNIILPDLFKIEGGFANRSKKADPGGATNLGITIRTLGAYRDAPVTIQDVKDLTKEEATDIYKIQYWDAVKGDQMPAGLDYALFDFAVNSGPGRAIRELQKILNVAVDGVCGIMTLNAIKKQQAVFLIHELSAARLAFMKGLKNWEHNKNGWPARVRHVNEVAVSLNYSRASPTPPPPEKAILTPQAKPDEIKLRGVAITPESISAAGGTVSALGGMLAGSGPIQWALAAVVVLSAAVGGYYLLNRIKRGEL